MTDGIKLDDVRVRVDAAFSLEVAELSLGPGLHVLVGPNGAGKSTLLKVMSQTLRYSGTVSVGNTVLGTARPNAQVVLLPQDPRGLEHMLTLDAVEYAALLYGADIDVLLRYCEAFGILESLGRRIRNLSGGQKQLAYLVMALAAAPQVLLLDEPTVGVDASHRTHLRSVVRDLARDRCVVVSTHLPGDIVAWGEDVVVLSGGRVAWRGPQAQLAAEVATAEMSPEARIEAALSELEHQP